jgi:hypothetical protein
LPAGTSNAASVVTVTVSSLPAVRVTFEVDELDNWLFMSEAVAFSASSVFGRGTGGGGGYCGSSSYSWLVFPPELVGQPVKARITARKRTWVTPKGFFLNIKSS